MIPMRLPQGIHVGTPTGISRQGSPLPNRTEPNHTTFLSYGPFGGFPTVDESLTAVNARGSINDSSFEVLASLAFGGAR